MKSQQKFWILMLLAVLILTVVSACKTSEYKTYTLKHNIIAFSFEYPSGYRKINEYLESNPQATIGVRFALGTHKDPVFGVNIDSQLSEVKVDPKTAADTAGSHTLEQEFERTVISIAGTTGEMVAYYYPDTKITSTVTREVFFNVNGVLWNIYIYSAADKADNAKLDFEHIISTFKVLP